MSLRKLPVANAKFLVLGGSLELAGIPWHDDPALPCHAVLLAGQVDPEDLVAASEVMPDPAVPVADFAANAETRHDFSAGFLDSATLADAVARFGPIIRRLAALPFRADRQDRGDILILRLAWSRDRPIEACFAPGARHLVDHPLIACATPKRAELEGLASRGLLRRRHFVRTNACSRCASNRLLAFEACNGCGSSNLADEAIVHHYRCGWQAPESSFVQAHALICPKCHRALRHFGMDYGKPGSIVNCRNCGTTTSEPEPRFACLDCGAVIGTHQASAMDWFHYDLTEAGMLALRSGRLPKAATLLGRC
jgi:hypothetical protein